MKRAHLLDRVIGDELPEFRTDEELRAFEATPYDERIAARSTYEALQIGAAHEPAAPAIHFLQRCEHRPGSHFIDQWLGRGGKRRVGLWKRRVELGELWSGR